MLSNSELTKINSAELISQISFSNILSSNYNRERIGTVRQRIGTPCKNEQFFRSNKFIRKVERLRKRGNGEPFAPVSADGRGRVKGPQIRRQQKIWASVHIIPLQAGSRKVTQK
jgi:hypothetical protein